ncbi:MAG: SUMF1/EgtB/PvdO family nonheme iron enzyme [Fibrobacterota bacterium]
MKRLLCLLVLSLVLTQCSKPAPGPEAKRVILANGNVVSFTKGRPEHVAVAPGKILRNAEIIDVGDASIAEVTVANDTFVFDGKTRFNLSSRRDSLRVSTHAILASGRCFLIAEPDPLRNDFLLTAGTVTVEAVHAYISFEIVEGAVSICVLAGQVMLRSRGTGEAVSVPAGKAAKVYAGAENIVVSRLTPAGVDALKPWVGRGRIERVARLLRFNEAPVLVSLPRVKGFRMGVYEYQIQAEDPDRDTLTFALIQAASGMSLDAKSGLLTWTPEQEGRFPVTVMVEDGKGGQVEQSFTLNVVNPVKPVSAVTPKPSRRSVNVLPAVVRRSFKPAVGDMAVVPAVTVPVPAQTQVPVRPPVIKISVGAPAKVAVKAVLPFAGIAESEDRIVLYEWDFEGDGQFEYASPVTGRTDHAFKEPGNYTALFRVRTAGGSTLSAKRTVEVTVSSLPPVLKTNGDMLGEKGKKVLLTAEAYDRDGEVARIAWSFSGDGQWDTILAASEAKTEKRNAPVTVEGLPNRVTFYTFKIKHVFDRYCAPVVRVTDNDGVSTLDTFRMVICPENTAGLDAVIERRRNIFCIDRYEWPNQEAVYPAADVRWSDARKYCASAGKRLCTLAEWRFACRGSQSTLYPYGNTYVKYFCNNEADGKLSKSGAFEKCVTGAGLYDMSGNVAEWTEGGGGDNQVLAGGSFKGTRDVTDCSAKMTKRKDEHFIFSGFRCCK